MPAQHVPHIDRDRVLALGKQDAASDKECRHGQHTMPDCYRF
jgi:hypothetical protein